MRIPVVFEEALQDVARLLDRGIYTPEGLRELIDEDIAKTKKAIAREMSKIKTDEK